MVAIRGSTFVLAQGDGGPGPGHPSNRLAASEVLCVRIGTRPSLVAGAVGPETDRLLDVASKGFPVADGVVLTRALTQRFLSAGPPTAPYRPPSVSEADSVVDPVLDALTTAWHRAARGGLFPAELRAVGASDGTGGVGVAQPVARWDRFLVALVELTRSTDGVFDPAGPPAVLVQRHHEPILTGTVRRHGMGRRAHATLTWQENTGLSPTGRDNIVTLDHNGRVQGSVPPPAALDRDERHDVATLARRLDGACGTNQRATWMFDEMKRLWLTGFGPVEDLAARPPSAKAATTAPISSRRSS